MTKRFFILSAVSVFMLTSCDVLMQTAANLLIPTNDEIIAGLKEALANGVQKGTGNLNKKGAFANTALKILLPPEVRSLEAKIRGNAILNAAVGGQLDKTIAAMNEGAENAMTKAVPIFKNAVSKMSFADAMGILKGGDGAATRYFKSTTTDTLQASFKPIIKTALDEVKLAEFWSPVVKELNKPLSKTVLGLKTDINPDLNQYVTELATVALFGEIEKQENAIRNNAAERSTALLKKVFDYADTQKRL
jgi:hypothetical protein